MTSMFGARLRASMPRIGFLLFALLFVGSTQQRGYGEEPAQPDSARTVGDRLFLWGHAAGVYNGSYTKAFKPSQIEPVEAATYMGLRNMYFIRCDNNPPLPFANYYRPFQKLDRVLWSLTGAAGVTSQEERDAVFRLAAENKNIVGFIMDDFFHADASTPAQWLAANKVPFPVVVTLTPPQPTLADRLTLAQSSWPSGDYRTGELAAEVTHDGKVWHEIKRLTLPNHAAAKAEIDLPKEPFSAVRVRILGTHDKSTIASCGLSLFELSRERKPIDTSAWKATASSSHAGYSPEVLVAPDWPIAASLAPEQLREIRERLTIGDRRLRLSVVVYVNQLSPRAKHHLQHVDEITMWTWRPEDLVHLEENLSKLESIAPKMNIVLGCYMFDFSRNAPLSVEQMKYQVELGYKWLQQGRIQGIIFLASPICDLELKAVEWTKEWTATVKDTPLERSSKSP